MKMYKIKVEAAPEREGGVVENGWWDSSCIVQEEPEFSEEQLFISVVLDNIENWCYERYLILKTITLIPVN